MDGEEGMDGCASKSKSSIRVSMNCRSHACDI